MAYPYNRCCAARTTDYPRVKAMWTISRSDMVLETLALLRRLKQAAARGEARVQFALRGKQRLRPLSEERVGQYRHDGYLLVSGLVPESLASGAEAAMWECVGAHVQAPETWAILGPRPHVLRDERFVATYTDSMLAAAAQLAGEDVASFRRPTHAFTINNVPVSRDWRPQQPHLDCTVAESRHRVFPRPYRIGTITYLTNVKPRGGGTLVWPGSHLKLEALARSDPGKYKYLSALSAELGRVAGEPAVELTPSRGDVLFHHYLCVHAGSDNVSSAPRLAILHKW
jgi:phytanoyl-CoA dioxygenase PhyH